MEYNWKFLNTISNELGTSTYSEEIKGNLKVWEYGGKTPGKVYVQSLTYMQFSRQIYQNT